MLAITPCKGIKAVVAVVALLFTWNAAALRIVFDPSNYVQNGITAAKSVLATAKQIEEYVLQVKQYETQLKNLAGTTAEDILGLAWNYREVQEAVEYARQLRSLYGTIQEAQRMIDRRVSEARQAGTSFDGFMHAISRQIADGNVYQKQRIQNERRLLDRVRGDYDAAASFAGRIQMTEGIHESVGLMNAQMNRFLAQNAQMIEIMGVTIPQAQNKQAQDELAREAQDAAAAEAAKQAFDAAEDRARRALERIGQ